jgi:chromosome segregation ATPase
MTTEHMDLEAEAAMLEALRRDVNALPARLARAREIERDATARAEASVAAHQGQLAQHRVELDGLTEKHKVECADRERELRARESAVAERERELEAKQQRVIERERWVEHRAADLTNRLRGAA